MDYIIIVQHIPPTVKAQILRYISNRANNLQPAVEQRDVAHNYQYNETIMILPNKKISYFF